MNPGRARHAAAALVAAVAVLLALGQAAVAAGPPYPDPVVDEAVYDYAGVLSQPTIDSAERTIDAIEQRTGAEVVVVTQLKPGATSASTAEDARQLINQWGVGRKGFDDGLAILFNLDQSLRHGQVQLYAAPGFEATFLTNQERQAIFEHDMVPLLERGDLDGAVLAALAKVDAAATPENAKRLEVGRQVNAIVGLVGGPFVFLVLVGWALHAWLLHGRDPVYLDDPSIHMPAPPPNLTAASGALVMEGRVTRRALTTAMLDLASRGKLWFREEHGLLGMNRKVGIETTPLPVDDVTKARQGLNDRRPNGPAERFALQRLTAIADDAGSIEPDELLRFGKDVPKFNEKLETHVVEQGWFGERPSATVNRWRGRGIIAAVAGGVVIWLGTSLPSDGLVVLGVAAIAGGIVVALLAGSMPAVTVPGAMIRAMLAAYRRTLQKTMAQSRSMDQVVADAGLDWLETPDQAVVWGTALGLQKDIEAVLERSVEDVRDGRAGAPSTYMPVWYGTSSGGAAAFAAGGGSVFASSAVPDFGGMMSALGTIGNAPSSSGGGGGFGGGGGGGGGGGAGGGF